MNIIFSSPFMLSALAAVGVFIGIYLLRNRFRTHVVSSLIFWYDRRKARQGGLQINRIQTPLLFLLELLTIILLVLAAAVPLIRAHSEKRLFVIVLDDSFSMLAPEGKSARDKAIDKIENLLRDSGSFNANFIIAGINPELLASDIKTIPRALDTVDKWQCLSPSSDLGKAVTLASQLAGETARILVITDTQPDMEIEKGRIEWQAFGSNMQNLAFISASRSSSALKDRCLLIIKNFSDKAASANLVVQSLDRSREIVRKSIELAPAEEYRLIFEMEDSSVPLRASIGRDALDIDNEIILLPSPRKLVRYQLNIKNQMLLTAVKKAIDIFDDIRSDSIIPNIAITDSEFTASDYDQWTVQFISEPNSSSYIGPFIMDRSHPLCEGLSLENVIWAAASPGDITSIPVIAAGNVPLITDTPSLAGSHEITIRLNPESSNLIVSPDWPILFWNLLNWRKETLPGFTQSNFQLGSSVTFTTDSEVDNVTLTAPDGAVSKRQLDGNLLLFEPYIPGLYTLDDQSSNYEFAVNCISPAESDLRQACSGIWGQWQQASLYWWEYKPLDWLLILIALILLSIHRYVTAGQMKGHDYDVS